jgi:pimeloyl-ACP methyl ester carboxylesterase
VVHFDHSLIARRSGFAPIDGTALAYEVAGAGDPVVLLHGFSLDRRMWDDQVDALARAHCVVRYDLRGFGESAAGDASYTHADDLGALLDRLNLTRVALVGLSLGGGAAINFTVLHPERVRALVVVDPSLGGFRWSAEFTAAQASVRNAARTAGVDAARDEWLSFPMFAAAMRNPAVAPRLRAIVHGYSGHHWLNVDRGRPFTPPAIERLAEILAPTLVIVGELDIPDFRAIADTLERSIPGAQKVVLPGAGHMTNMEAPVSFNDVVLDFLATSALRA